MARWERRRESRPSAALDVIATKSAVDRALRVMDALIKALEARGYPTYCSLRPAPPRSTSGYIAARWGDPATNGGRARAPTLMTRVAVGDEDVFLTLREVVSKVPRPTTSLASPLRKGARVREQSTPVTVTSQRERLADEHVGSGRFVLTIPHTPGNYREHWVWDEGRKRTGPLEEGLNAVIVAVVEAADEFHAWRERVLAEQRAAEERARAAYVEQQARAAEAARVQRLEEEAAAWIKANQIRAYVAAVRAAATRFDGAQPTEALAAWAAWAEGHADRIDPVAISRGCTSEK
jgi:hypothetical protein